MLKKFTAVLLAAIMLICTFSGCAGVESASSDKLKIVCTVFPYYDWVRNLIKDVDNAEVILLLNTGTDLHSYQPTAEDIITISTADIFVYTGGTSDSWVTDVLKTSKNEKAKLINLCEVLGEEKLCCVEAIGDESHSHEEEDGHTHTHDEHIWLSVRNAITLTNVISDALCEKNPENKDTYEKNRIEYTDKLSALDKKYESTLAATAKNTLVFADRFPFIYLTTDYSLSYAAAFSGCSAESEASFETVTALAEKIDEVGLSYILITETSDGSVANTVKNSTKSKNQEILVLNAMQSITKSDIGTGYIEIMESNLKVLEKALS